MDDNKRIILHIINIIFLIISIVVSMKLIMWKMYFTTLIVCIISLILAITGFKDTIKQSLLHKNGSIRAGGKE